MDLSIVIPAYNEEAKIALDVAAAAAFLAGAQLKGEIVVVDDGSSDNTAGAARQVAVPRGVACRVVRYQPNRGKGCAVRTGMLATTGEFAMFADSGLCVPYLRALRGLEMLRSGTCDIAHGSRKLPETHIVKPQNAYRRLCSWAFRRFVFAFVGPRALRRVHDRRLHVRRRGGASRAPQGLRHRRVCGGLDERPRLAAAPGPRGGAGAARAVGHQARARQGMTGPRVSAPAPAPRTPPTEP